MCAPLSLRRDLTEGTLGGSVISLVAAVVMVFLFLAELSAFVQTTTHTSVVIDRSTDGDLLKINFNISFPRLSCEFASVDVSDALGMVRRMTSCRHNNSYAHSHPTRVHTLRSRCYYV